MNLFEEDKKKKAAALVLRGGFRQEPEAQLQDYGQAIDLDPGNADAWQARALVHLDQGEADKAIEDFNSLLKQNENNANAHLALAEALTNLEKLDEALPHIEKAIQLKPDSPLGYTLRARWKVLKEDIQSEDANFTRFFVLEKNPGPVEGANKTSIVFATKNAPGALHKCLGEFASRGVNLSKLESRPRRNKPWVYVFYADIEGSMDDPDCHAAVGGLLKTGAFVKVLGSYKKA